jgi:very-short-patch-repair endonuclease
MRSMVEGVLRAPIKTIARARQLRRALILPEVVLWQALRNGRLTGFRFRRQHPIGPYILDFYCASARLAIEVVGFVHDTAARVRHDDRRGAWLSARGVSVLRVRPSDVLQGERLEAVLAAIEQAAGAPSGALCAPPPPQAGEEPPSGVRQSALP